MLLLIAAALFGTTPAKACPPVDCDAIEDARLACEGSGDDPGTGCEHFVAMVDAQLCREPGSAPNLWSCSRQVGPWTEAAEAAFSTLGRLRGGRAPHVFGSARFRSVLDGEVAEEYAPKSLETEAALKAGRPPPLRPTVSLRASSWLAPIGGFDYRPLRAGDLSSATAWCEGARGQGVGQWVEASWDVPPGWKGRAVSTLLVQRGYAKDEATYLANGRPTKVKVTPCGGSRGDTFGEFDWDLGASDFDGPAQDLTLPPWLRQRVGTCVRLTLLEVEPGKHRDACISEFHAVLACDSAADNLLR